MKVVINGEKKEITDGMTILDMIQSLRLKPERIAVELNRRVLERENYVGQRINENDRIELLRFLGGG